MADARRLAELGMSTELAKELAAQIDAIVGSVPAANVTGLASAVEAAVAAKTQIAALTSGSDAADIVAALQA